MENIEYDWAELQQYVTLNEPKELKKQFYFLYRSISEWIIEHAEADQPFPLKCGYPLMLLGELCNILDDMAESVKHNESESK